MDTNTKINEIQRISITNVAGKGADLTLQVGRSDHSEGMIFARSSVKIGSDIRVTTWQQLDVGRQAASALGYAPFEEILWDDASPAKDPKVDTAGMVKMFTQRDVIFVLISKHENTPSIPFSWVNFTLPD